MRRGISSYAFAKSDCSVTALEPDSSHLVGSTAIGALFAKTGLPVNIVEEAGENLPFPDETFDIVYGRAVFHHVNDLTQFYREAHRVLKTNGIFIMTREHVISCKEDLKIFLDTHPLHFLYGGESAYLLEEYLEAICLSGLKVQNTIGSFENVINYAPTTVSEFQQMVVQPYLRFLGKRLAKMLSKLQFFIKWRGQILSRKSE